MEYPDNSLDGDRDDEGGGRTYVFECTNADCVRFESIDDYTAEMTAFFREQAGLGPDEPPTPEKLPDSVETAVAHYQEQKRKLRKEKARDWKFYVMSMCPKCIYERYESGRRLPSLPA